MMKSVVSYRFLIAAVFASSTANAEYLRESAQRLRHFDDKDPSTYQVSAQNPEAAKLFAQLANNRDAPLDYEGEKIDEEAKAEEEAFQGLLGALERIGVRSMSPTAAPTPADTTFPSTSPTSAPSVATSDSPTVSTGPSASPSLRPTLAIGQTSSPTSSPTFAPTTPPTSAPTATPTVLPTLQPTVTPSQAPTIAPTTLSPTSTPTLARCGISEEDRNARLLALLELEVVDSSVLLDMTTPQGLATDWILNQDEAVICPDDPKFLQRWVLAVIYYSTGGDEWVQCSANPLATDDCGNIVPNLGATRFLSGGSECDWAGISCIDDCVTEIEFEENNLNGIIPTEIGLLSDLAVWGMERGGLTSTIPTEVGRLTKLIFLDLDFNQLTGSLPDELFTLTDLTQLDVNDNQLTGSINNIGVFTAMEFLQLHSNEFTGTVPTEVGTFTNLAAFTLHETLISGTMPAEAPRRTSNARAARTVVRKQSDALPL
eukprot:scaffold2720_cov173-Amphora_coffeaeformis.AAC.21